MPGALRVGFLLVVTLLASLAMQPAVAQESDAQSACAPPRLAFPDARNRLDPGGGYSLPFAVENPNGPHVEVARADVTVTTPDGWSAIPTRRELTMGPGTVQHNVLSITAPSRGTGAPSGNITISVTFVCTTGVVQQTSRPAEHVIQVRIQAFEAPWLVVIGAFAVLAASVGILGLRRLRRGVLLTPVEATRGVQPGKSAKYLYVAHNRRGKPGRYRVLATGIPEGWSIHLALNEIDLEPGEEKALWAILRAPINSTPGQDVPFTLKLQGERGPKDVATAALVAHVEAPE